MKRSNIKPLQVEPARYGMTGRGMYACYSLTSEGYAHALSYGGPIDAPECIPRGSIRRGFVSRKRKGLGAYVYASATERR